MIILTFLSRFSIFFKKGGKTTDARFREGQDIRNAFTLAAAASSSLVGIDPTLLVNMDATSFLYENNKTGENVWVPEKRAPGKTAHNPKSHHKSSGLNKFIKYYLIMNSSGTISQEVYVIGDDSMGEEDFEVTEIKGLSSSNHVGAKGWLCVTKTRGGNKSFYRWLFDVAVKGFIAGLREDLKKEGDSDETVNSMPAALLFDGELNQIQVLFEDNRAQSLSEDYKTLLVKLAASCSGVQQPCDISLIFLSTKKTLKHLEYIPGHPVLETELKSYLKHRFPTNSRDQKVMREGLMTLIDAHQRANHRAVYTKGWIDSGISPLNVESILYNCTKVVSEDELNICLDGMEQASKEFKEKGFLSEVFMDGLGIPDFRAESEKRAARHDARPIHQQRVTILNHKDVAVTIIDKTAAKIEEKARSKEKREKSAILLTDSAPGLFDACFKNHNDGPATDQPWAAQNVLSIKSIIEFMNTLLAENERGELKGNKPALISTLDKLFTAYGQRIKALRNSNTSNA